MLKTKAIQHQWQYFSRAKMDKKCDRCGHDIQQGEKQLKRVFIIEKKYKNFYYCPICSEIIKLTEPKKYITV